MPITENEDGSIELHDLVLIIGNLATDTITSTIKLYDKTYLLKLLSNSSPQNWDKIVKLLQTADKSAFNIVLVQFTESILEKACDKRYQELFYKLCEILPRYDHAVFMYEDNINNQFNYIGAEYFHFLDDLNRLESASITEDGFLLTLSNGHTLLMPEEIVESQKNDILLKLNSAKKKYERTLKDCKKIVSFLKTSKVNILPYKTKSDLNVSAKDFIESNIRGLIFRFYVTTNRLWSEELDKLLILFKDYLKNLEGYSVSLETNRTQHGVIYAFYCTDNEIQ
jgi:hypothetical protein